MRCWCELPGGVQAGPDPEGGRAGTQGAGTAGRKRQPLPTSGVTNKETYILGLSQAHGARFLRGYPPTPSLNLNKCM